MSYELTKTDYMKILAYYDIKVPKTTEKIKQDAENILAKKLCSCIKKVNPVNEAESIGVCTRSIFNRKQLKRGTFRCKRREKVSFRKTRKSGIQIGRKK
jgi:hypothetical protein